MRKYFIGLVLAPFLNITIAFACSAPLTPSVEVAYKESVDVYIAIATSIKNTPEDWNESTVVVRQEVVFKVLEVFKGSKKYGDTVVFNTSIVRGGCGVSPTNSPHWLEKEFDRNDIDSVKSNEIIYPNLSGIWLIYDSESGSHSLNRTGRNSPFEIGGVHDLKKLYKLSGKRKN